MKNRFIALRACGSLTLFLTTFWLFFSYGRTDLAMAPPMDDIFSTLLIIPYLGIPVFILGLRKMSDQARFWVQMGLLLIIFISLMNYVWIITYNTSFSSGWVWTYNDLRELHYLSPWTKVVCFVAEFCLFILDCDEFLHISHKEPDHSSAFGAICTIIIGFVIFGGLQTWLTGQPIWISLSILTIMVALLSCVCFIDRWQNFRQANVITVEPHIAPKTREKLGQLKGFTGGLGLFLLCVWIWLLPAQLVFQEGPSNPWGFAAIVGAIVGIILMAIWKQFKAPPRAALTSVILGAAIAPAILFGGSNRIPNSIQFAEGFALVGAIGLLAWILYYGVSNPRLREISLVALWLWAMGYVVFFHDPILEIWEMEEGLIKANVDFSDTYGTGIGAYYGVVFWISFALLLSAGAIWGLLEAKMHSSRTKSDNKMPSTPAQIQLSHQIASIAPSTPSSPVAEPTIKTTNTAFRNRVIASALICVFLFGTSFYFYDLNLNNKSPVVVAEIEDHGVLWRANSYDRVLPNYNPDFSHSPRNSTVAVQAMRGETELVQLVFSPLASKMISFQLYQWGSSVEAPADFQWKDQDGNLANISIDTGIVGYLGCFDSNIADVMTPWSAFITTDRQNIPFWLELTVPRDTAPGIYTTEFQFLTTSYIQRVPRPISLQFQFQMTVWNIIKPLNRTVDTCIGLWTLDPSTQDSLLKLAFKYGVDPYGVGSPETVYDADNLSKGLFINWTSFDLRVQEMLDAGMNQIKLDFYPGIDCRFNADALINGSMNNYLTLIRWFYENASIHLSGKLTPWNTTWESETITQHSDEPDPNKEPNALQAFDILYKLIDKATKIKTFQTFAYEPIFDEWLDCLDIWVFTPDSYTVEGAKKIHDAGREIWTYSNGDNFPGTDTDLGTPLILSRLRGWVDYHYNITGFLHWVFYWNYNDAGRSGCGYDGRGDGTVIVPHEGGFLPTLRLAAFRDGLEDNQLLWILNQTIVKAQANGFTGSILDEAIKVMQSVDQALSAQPADAKWDLPVITRGFDHNPCTYMDLRVRCGSILSQLLTALNE